MANVKSLDQSSDKWVRRAQVAGEDYKAGIENPRTPWATAASGAEGNYKAGVTAAAGAGRYGAGVKRAGDDKWRRNAAAKGPSRYAEGVQVGVDEWRKGFSPYHAALSQLQLPARGPKGSAQNLQRVAAVAQANRAVKDRGVR